MALDTSIPLQTKNPDINPLAAILQVGQYKQQQAVTNRLTQDTNSNLAVGQAIQRNTDANGNVNRAGVQADLAQDPNAAYGLQAATGQNLVQQGQQISNDTNAFALHKDYTNTALQTAAGLLRDPRISAPPDKYDPEQASSALSDAFNQMVAKGVPVNQALVATAPFVNAIHQPGAVATMLKNTLVGQLGAPQQLGATTPNPTLTSDGATFKYRDTNPLTNPGIVGDTFDAKLTPQQAASRVDTVDAQGRPGTIPFSAMVPRGLLPPAYQDQGSMQPQPASGRYPQPAQPAQSQIAQGGFIPSGFAPGVKQAADVAGQGSGQQLVADQQSNADSGKRMNMLQNASDALANATTGQGAEKLQAFKSALVTAGLASQSQVDSVKNYDEANKYLTQYATAKAASFGGTTDAQLAAAMTGNGNTHISNLASQDVVKVNMGLERMEQARMQQWQRSGLPADQYATWKSQFGATMDPRVFIADQLDPQKLKGMLQRMNQQQRDTFSQQYRWAVQNGYINGPQ